MSWVRNLHVVFREFCVYKVIPSNLPKPIKCNMCPKFTQHGTDGPELSYVTHLSVGEITFLSPTWTRHYLFALVTIKGKNILPCKLSWWRGQMENLKLLPETTSTLASVGVCGGTVGQWDRHMGWPLSPSPATIKFAPSSAGDKLLMPFADTDERQWRVEQPVQEEARFPHSSTSLLRDTRAKFQSTPLTNMTQREDGHYLSDEKVQGYAEFPIESCHTDRSKKSEVRLCDPTFYVTTWDHATYPLTFLTYM